MLKLFRYLKPYWKSALLAPLLMLIEVYMDLLQPKLMASIVNEGVLQGNLPHIQTTGLLMLGTALIGLIGGIGCTFFSSIASQHFGADIRSDLFQKVQSFSFRNLDQFKAGSLVTRLTNDVVQMQNLVQMTLRILVRAPFLAIGSLIMAVTISFRLAGILAVVIPILFIVLFLLIRYAFPLFSKVQNKLDTVNNVLQENLAGIRVVKAFVRSRYETGRFGKANNDYTDMAMKATRIVALNMPVMTLIMNVSIVAVLWYGGNLTWEGSLPVGDLIAFINYVTQVLFSLLSVGMMLMFISRAKASADRIHEVLRTESEIADAGPAAHSAVGSGQVRFERVSFTYNADSFAPTDTLAEQKELVLKDIDFTAEPGQTIAILGATGSGKSTLVNLIPRLYETTRGRVLIDGTDIRHIGLEHLRSHIGMVLQQAILFTGTIRDNIRFGRPDAAQEEVEAAAKAADAHDFIMRMPDGYDTQLGQRGVNLSGGQKQRVSIARALLMRPAILILDDSTSAVDLGTESRIQAAIKSLMQDTTCFIIAQRITSVLDADKILVLDDGRIVAEGTHDELIRQSPEYQDIYNSQLGKGAVAHG
ncbi:Putative multidrug export ATP-binding/permease protein [Paenibacillus konkukensis]|uniref:Multidrug export ATP-binding/permease protein n=1 Tax=Paenibacillus konkukensis TaxID=2020716 RepID=A0ABY4RTA7_9BACL|nr:ABC transporter ATP-binding protein [Paenibacillus konkukensis]UQZ84763.1 Putative multidrug export ATP-binding/permease protein [Paenibacillus konkukensis]